MKIDCDNYFHLTFPYNKMILINQTLNGQVFKCDNCDAIHIEFKNLNFNFSVQQYDQFADYISKIDPDEWEATNKDSIYKRKIIIPTGHKNVNLMLDAQELKELNSLFNQIRQKAVPVFTNIAVSSKAVKMNFTYFFN